MSRSASPPRGSSAPDGAPGRLSSRAAARLRARVAQAEADAALLLAGRGVEPPADDPRWEGDPAEDGVWVEEWDPQEVLACALEDARRAGLPPESVASSEEIRRHEAEVALGPFWRSDWQLDLAEFREAARRDSRRLAEDALLLDRLAAQVPRRLGDERGGSAWTSFVREVAVARAVSERTAAEHVHHARLLAQDLPGVSHQLSAGLLPVGAARALLAVAATACSPEGLAALDALAAQCCLLPAWEVRALALRTLLAADADAAAARAARAAKARHTRLRPADDEQAELVLSGPAVPLGQAWAALDADARALRAAGDPRTLDQLRLDLGVTRLLAGHLQEGAPSHAPAREGDAAGVPVPGDTSSPRWLLDRRFSRPVQVLVTVPVTTARGLADDPAYLAGYGWISAPSARLLLPAAELRQLCTVAPDQPGPGTVLDRAPDPVRPPPTPRGVADALEAMMTAPFPITDAAWREEPGHDPSPDLRALVQARDPYDDGPTGTATTAERCDLDHQRPWPEGPTAAWNLTARSRRTHVLKHLAWEAVRTSVGTVWTSPAGQTALRPTSTTRSPASAPGVLPGPGTPLPDPDALQRTDLALVTGWPEDPH